MKAILIARVSTEEQKEMGLSLPAQIARLEKYCLTKGLNVIKSCSFDESAYSDQRTAFDNIVDFILSQKEKIAVCCDKVDRLSRNMFDKRISALYDKALKDEIELHFVSDNQIINSQISAATKFQFSISLGLAKYYSDAISDNVKRASEQKLRRGEWTHKAPYGYKNITREDGKKDIIIDELVAPIIEKCFQLYATGAYSFEILFKKIKDEYNVSWSSGYIDKLLNNHFYYGIMIINGKSYPHRYPPIISKDLFDQAQQVKTGFNRKNQYKYAGKPYLYRGVLRCSECGLAITPEKHKGHIYYHCTQYNGKHGAKWLREEEITKQFTNIFKRLQIPTDILQQTISTLKETHQNKIDFYNKNLDKLTSDQKNIAKKLEILYQDRLDGRITETDYDNFFQKVCQQRDDINFRLNNLQKAESNYYTTTKSLLELSNRAHELFLSSEVDQKRQLLKLVLSNLRVEGENIVYDAQEPFKTILECSDYKSWRPQGDSNPCYQNENLVS